MERYRAINGQSPRGIAAAEGDSTKTILKYRRAGKQAARQIQAATGPASNVEGSSYRIGLDLQRAGSGNVGSAAERHGIRRQSERIGSGGNRICACCRKTVGGEGKCSVSGRNRRIVHRQTACRRRQGQRRCTCGSADSLIHGQIPACQRDRAARRTRQRDSVRTADTAQYRVARTAVCQTTGVCRQGSHLVVADTQIIDRRIPPALMTPLSLVVAPW